MCHEFGHELGLPDLYNPASMGRVRRGFLGADGSGPFDGAGAIRSHGRLG